eukprot:1426292-Pleurochrysis_carterae.AAC.1
MPTSERRSDDHFAVVVIKFGQAGAWKLTMASKSSAIADGGGVNLLKNCRVSDMSAYKLGQKLLGAQVVGAFALNVLFLCWSCGLAASSSRSGARMQMSWCCSRISAGQGVVQRCILVLNGVQSGFKLRSKTSYKLSALRPVPWFAEQALGSVVKIVVYDDEQAGDVQMSWISGGYKKSGTSFGQRFTKRNYRTAML